MLSACGFLYSGRYGRIVKRREKGDYLVDGISNRESRVIVISSQYVYHLMPS